MDWLDRIGFTAAAPREESRREPEPIQVRVRQPLAPVGDSAWESALWSIIGWGMGLAFAGGCLIGMAYAFRWFVRWVLYS